jgi:hypothetical protein
MRALLWLLPSISNFKFRALSVPFTRRSPRLPLPTAKLHPGGALARATHRPVCLLLSSFNPLPPSTPSALLRPVLGVASCASIILWFLSGYCRGCCSWRRGEEEMGGSGKWVKSLIGLKKPDREDCKVRASRKIAIFGFPRFDFSSCPRGTIWV